MRTYKNMLVLVAKGTQNSSFVPQHPAKPRGRAPVPRSPPSLCPSPLNGTSASQGPESLPPDTKHLQAPIIINTPCLRECLHIGAMFLFWGLGVFSIRGTGFNRKGL